MFKKYNSVSKKIEEAKITSPHHTLTPTMLNTLAMNQQKCTETRKTRVSAIDERLRDDTRHCF